MKFDSVICDWLSFRHDFAFEKPVEILESGRVMKLSRDGEIEWESTQWETVRCASSDTSIRIKCDGQHLWFSGNIGRFQEMDNLTGLTVMQCFEKAVVVIKQSLFLLGLRPDLSTLGTRSRVGTLDEYGTVLTRIDLASNFSVDSYAQLCQLMTTKRIGQKLPMVGKYGPTWGYDSKRGQFWKAKFYDKTCELEGRRTPTSGATTARFEVQLGSQYLKQYSLDQLKVWGEDMANIIYGKFAAPLFRESAGVEDWSEISPKLRAWAVLWRDGVDVRSYFKNRSGFWKVKTKLLEHGIDISVPCNVFALTQRIRTIEVRQLQALRGAA